MRKENKKTVVRGIRAPQNFWERCDVVANREQKTRNDLIVKVVSEYCKKTIDKQDKA